MKERSCISINILEKIAGEVKIKLNFFVKLSKYFFLLYPRVNNNTA
jgi:hypothetical protein